MRRQHLREQVRREALVEVAGETEQVVEGEARRQRMDVDEVASFRSVEQRKELAGGQLLRRVGRTECGEGW